MARARFSPRILSLVLSFLTISSIAAAQGTITNGQTVTGTFTASGDQVWNFTAPSTGTGDVYACAAVNPLSTGSAEFYLGIGAQKKCTFYNSGANSISVHGTGAGTYSLNLEMGAVPYLASLYGGTLYTASTASGSVFGNNYNIYSLPLAVGDHLTLTLTMAGTIRPSVAVYRPDGGQFTSGTGSTNTITLTPAAVSDAGNYIVILGTYNQFLTAPVPSTGYTLTVSGASVLPTDGKTDGKFCLACALGGSASGDPINTATGNLFEQVTDYSTAGQNPLVFTRSYSSLSQPHNVIPTTLGPNWRSNYDRYLRILTSTMATAERADGRIINFYLVSGVWTPDTDVDVKLAQSGSTWTLTDSNDTVETYSVTGSLGLLQTIVARNGYTQTLSWGGTTLNSVTDSYSRALSFTYSGGMLSGVTTPDTLVLSYGYTTTAGQSLLTSVGYNTAPATSQTYLYENAAIPFGLTGLTDENSNRYATWAYDPYGRANSSQHAVGAGLTTIAYDDSTGNRTVTGPLGIADTYKFTTLQGIPKLTEVDRAANGTVAAATRTQGYDSAGYLNSQHDWNGNSTTYVNNSHGLPTTINEAVGSTVARTTMIVYDTTWVHLPHTITATGLTTTNTYDTTTGNLTQKVLADTTASAGTYAAASRTWTYTYTATGQLQTAVNPRTDLTTAQRTTTYGYTGGTLTSITNGLGQATSITAYTGGGRPQTIVDPNGVTTTLTYSPRQWLLTSSVATSGGARLTTLGYDAAGNLTSTTLPDSSQLTNTYDAAHRLTNITDLSTDHIDYTLDAMGNRTAVSVAAGTKVRYVHSDAYDAIGRTYTDTKGTNRTTTYGYDKNGNATSIADPDGHPATAQVFDALNRLQQTTDPASDVTAYTYDTHDRPLTVTAGNGAVTTYTYDGFGDVGKEVSADRGTTTYFYDAMANRTKKTDARTIVANYTYDALNRRTAANYPAASTENVSYVYDQTGHGFGIGRLTSMTDQAGSFSRSYDERGNITSETRIRGTVSLTTGYSYDPSSRVATITYPDGMIVTQNRNVSGRISTMTLKPSASGASQYVLSKISDYPFGPTTPVTYGNSVGEIRGYDGDYRLTSNTDNGTRSTIQGLTFGYDGNSNLTSIADSVTPANNQTLTYDNDDRLLTATGAYGSESFTYDGNGNRLTAGSTTYTYTPNSNRLLTIGGVSVGTDAAGNITSLPATATTPALTLTYNNAGRLATATGLSYLYDGFGQRITKTDTAQRFQQYSQDGLLIEQTDNLGSPQTDYIYLEGTPVATFVPGGAAGTLSFLHVNNVNAPQKATNASQAIGWSINTDAFGVGAASVGTIANDLRFPGQEYELGTGHNHNGFRDYIPGIGRYLESDPTGLSGGVNTYDYASNSPGRWVDPLGTADGNQVGGITPSTGGGSYSTSAGYTYGSKIARQMSTRGWSNDQIDSAVTGGQRIAAVNRATGGPATRYECPITGKSVTVDDTTNEVIQVGGQGFAHGPESGDVPGAQMQPPPSSQTAPPDSASDALAIDGADEIGAEIPEEPIIEP